MSSTSLFNIFLISSLTLLVLFQEVVSVDYGAALTKSLLYFEAQRSGQLPPTQRVQWRADSALRDGSDLQTDLVGGYYDAGDNVKFGFPMAFTITMLAWSVIEFEKQLQAKNELSNALDAVKWGTDYLIKANPQANLIYAQVGDGDADHACWERPEDMMTPRVSYVIDDGHPGTDLAGETSAAFSAAAIAFNKSNPAYSKQLLTHAKLLFEFAKSRPGKYSDSIPIVGKFYNSSDFKDELSWAAAWLHRSMNDQSAIEYLHDEETETGGTRSMFSWDDKYLGAQLILEGHLDESDEKWGEYKSSAEAFICNCIGKGDDSTQRTSGGLLWFQPFNNLQYTTAALFIIQTYSDYLNNVGVDFDGCNEPVTTGDLYNFVQTQVDYILGVNPKNMSYMVGFGSNYPQKVHHRGSSIVSIKKDKALVTCRGGMDVWFKKDAPNPNVLDGAIVGGPDQSDAYLDDRSNYQQAEPATANTAPLVGVLARHAAP
ncbi:hypothetical protein JRO89_XS14G0107500 [Xanthoceras sorbifolium]|uniref:Endoglucanase n=1 Tax=Xanthoceras sorbifolium TaxID=99658 RepID=A0ABQ8H505_9ROSI|nr:hypothetical protein JRO89_XS14G0107500 [Xanthoceras sorbifolium]